MHGLRKLVPGKVALYAGVASLLVVGAPAAAMAHTVTAHTASHHASTAPADAHAKSGRVPEPAGFKLDSCTGTVFGGITLRNVASGNYLAMAPDSSLVLYTHTNQRLDGYRDASGHLIIYICGTNDVFTDNPTANCTSGYRACAYVEPYTDSQYQWWSRDISGNVWEVECIGPDAGGKVLDDPHGTNAEGTHVTLRPLAHNNSSEEFTVG